MAAALLRMSLLPPLTRQPAMRSVGAGVAWGLIFTAGTAAYASLSCGIICLDEVGMTAAISMTAGIVTIGPLAAFSWRT